MKISYAGTTFDDQELQNVTEVMKSGRLVSGDFTGRFERDLAEFIGVDYCLSVNSGSSANLLAVSALTSPALGDRRLKPGDEVITTAVGFPTTIAPIIQNRLIPVFVDVRLGSYNTMMKTVEQAIAYRTKAIFLAHTLGNPFDVEMVMKIAEKYNLWVVEDCCDALGSDYNGKKVGGFGHLSTFSFYPAHHITTGEGGAVLTNDSELMKAIRSFRDWGKDCWCKGMVDNSCGRRFEGQYGQLPPGYDHRYVYSHLGYNLKMTEFQAAVGTAQMKKLPGFIEARKRNFRMLREALQKYEEYFILPESLPDADPSWFAFPLTVRKRFTRQQMVNHLESHGVMTRVLFSGNFIRQPACAGVDFRMIGHLPNSDKVMKDTFFIGLWQGIGGKEIDYMVKVLEKLIN